jgi:hypothetical protein
MLLFEIFATVSTAFISRALTENKRKVAKTVETFDAFEEVQDPGTLLLPDGREVRKFEGKTYALKMSEHQKRLEAAFLLQQNTNSTEAMSVNEHISTISCPQLVAGRPCGGTLNVKTVCGMCVSKKLGYNYRYSSDYCGIDIVTKKGT